jgi:hypothetical protein
MSENEITYNAVEKDGVITAIWEMKGRKHIRTIDPRSQEGKRLLGSYKPNEPSSDQNKTGTSH